MTSKQEYQKALWIKISRLPYLVALGMEGTVGSGVAGTAGKRHAMAESFIEGRRSYPANQIIRALIPDVDNDAAHLLEITRQHDEVLDCLDDKGLREYPDLKNYLKMVLNEVIDSLQTHESPQTVREYKDWLLFIVEKVAMASKEGDFLGIGGERFSPKERAFYAELKTLLYPERS